LSEFLLLRSVIGALRRTEAAARRPYHKMSMLFLQK
jgi:hypothetical protein